MVAFISLVLQTALGVLIAWGVRILIDKYLVRPHPELELPEA